MCLESGLDLVAVSTHKQQHPEKIVLLVVKLNDWRMSTRIYFAQMGIQCTLQDNLHESYSLQNTPGISTVMHIVF